MPSEPSINLVISSSQRRLAPPPAVAWRVWPLAEGLHVAAPIVGSLLLVGLVVGVATAQARFGAVAALLLAAAQWRFLAPTYFEMNGQGTSWRQWGRQHKLPWRFVKSHEFCRRGVFLSPTRAAGLWNAWRGLYIPWDQHRKEVTALVTFYLLPDDGDFEP